MLAVHKAEAHPVYTQLLMPVQNNSYHAAWPIRSSTWRERRVAPQMAAENQHGCTPTAEGNRKRRGPHLAAIETFGNLFEAVCHTCQGTSQL